MKRILLALTVLLLATPAGATWQKGVAATADACSTRLRPGDVCWWVAADGDDGTNTADLDVRACATLTYGAIEEASADADGTFTARVCESTGTADADCVPVAAARTFGSAVVSQDILSGNVPFADILMTTVSTNGASFYMACGGQSPY